MRPIDDQMNHDQERKFPCKGILSSLTHTPSPLFPHPLPVFILKVHKIEIFFCFDFEICIISL
jgi:hypothetical protein